MSLLREARALLELVDDMIQTCSITTGTCCCGGDMATHDTGMHSGHSPVDQGAHYAAGLQEQIRDLLQRLPPAKPIE